MDDIINELQAAAEEVPVPLDLPTDEDLLNVEEALFLPLPRDYREFLMEVSDLVLGSLEPATASDPSAHTYLPELAASCWAHGLPRYLIPICVTGRTVYAITPEGEVQSWLGKQQQDPVWETVWDWAEQVWLAGARKS